MFTNALAVMLLAAVTLSTLSFAAPTSSITCTDKTMIVRKEWSSLTLTERQEYTNAVTCLMNSPSKLDSAAYPGAKNRYADFIATHINYTFTIHLDAIFLPWHRNFVQLYENALRDECKYEGSQPYWDWSAYVDGDLRNSTLFDGSEYSLGSDGIFTNETLYITSDETYPSGTGGGCVLDGPFSSYTAPFRTFPQSLILDNVNGSLPTDAFDYSPHCFSRNLNDYALRQNNNKSSIQRLLSQETIGDFQNVMSGPMESTDFGPHGGGHFAMGGSGSDLFTSPTDPAFFLHHAQVDNMWWQWQSKNLTYGLVALNGTKTLLNVPASDPLTLDDYLQWGPLAEEHQVRDLMSISAGPFCYRYE